MSASVQPVICIVGPTATGKSELAQRIALDIGAEVISADSMQVYRGMDIGTGKVPVSARCVPYHGIDLVDPGEPYSAALFQDYARSCFSDIESRGKRSVLVGGTGFYVRAAIDDYNFPPGDQLDNSIREQCERFAADAGAEALWERLYEVDPDSANLIHPHNVRRVTRAFELLAENNSYADLKDNLASLSQCVPACFIGLACDADTLRKRIDHRVDHMIEAGLVEEVQGLLDRGFREAITANQAIGYKEIVRALDGLCTLDDAIEAVKVATHQYAKRQRSWFGRDSRIAWINADAPFEDVCRQARCAIDQAGVLPAMSDAQPQDDGDGIGE